MKIDIHSTNHKYRVIYADPAWQFKSKKSGGSMKSGAAQVYSVTSIEDMKALPVARLAENNCMLVMWWVGSMPQEAIDLLSKAITDLCTMMDYQAPAEEKAA